MNYELGIVGAGNMAEAIARGVIGNGLLRSNQIIAADVSPERRSLFTREMGIQTVEDNLAAVRDAKVILLSVKPQQMAAALAGIGETIQPTTLVISIAAGISTAFIEKNLGPKEKWRVIRTMPNTPMLVGMGMTALAPGANAKPDDVKLAKAIFESAGAVVEVEESKIDAVTAVSGSGPAYFFFLVEQMIAAGVELGLSPEQARLLASQTALGSAKMLTTSSDQPAELRRKVTSPGGTTNAAITHMESQKMGVIVQDAVKAAARRSAELGM